MIIRRITTFSVTILLLAIKSVSSSEFVPSIESYQSEKLRKLEDEYYPKKVKHHPKPKNDSGSSGSTGGSGGGSSGGGSSGGGGGSSKTSSRSAKHSPVRGNAGFLLVGAAGVVAVAGAVATAATYRRPKEQITIHPLKGVLAKRVSRFESLAAEASIAVRPKFSCDEDVSCDGSNYNSMTGNEDYSMQAVV